MNQSRWISIILVLLLSGCATPSNRSTMPWQGVNNYLYVNPIAEGRYMLEEYQTTHEGLKKLLEDQMAMGLDPEVVIYAPLRKNYRTQAKIAMLAENLGLKVYRYGPFGHLDIDSQTLLELAD